MLNARRAEFIFVVLLLVEADDEANVFALKVGDVVGWGEGVASLACYLAAVLGAGKGEEFVADDPV